MWRMDSKNVTLASTLLSSSLFIYCLTHKKRQKHTVVLLALGILLKHIGRYGKSDIINNIGNTALNSYLFALIGLCASYPLYVIGNRSKIGCAVSLYIGASVGFGCYKSLSQYTKDHKASSSFAQYIYDSQYHLRELI